MAQPVLVAVLHEAPAGVDHEDALAGIGTQLVEHDDAGRNAGAVEQVGGQPDDALDVAALDQAPPDHGLGVATEQHTVRQDHRAAAGALHRGQDVQQEGIVAVLGGWGAVGEAPVHVAAHVDAVAPGFGREGRVGHHEVEGLQGVALRPLWRGQRVALPDFGGGGVVQDHVHLGERGGGVVYLLPVDGHAAGGLGGGLEQQRAGAAGRVEDGLRRVLGTPDADDAGHDPRHLGGGVELPLALARLGGEVPHQVLVGVAQQVVALGVVLAEVQRRVGEDADQIAQAVHHLLALAQLVGVVEVGERDHAHQVIGLGQPGNDLVHLVADLGVVAERHHVLEAAALRHFDQRVRLPGVPVADVLHEQHDQHVVLVLGGVHAAPQFIAASPQRAVQFTLLDCHVVSIVP